MMFAVLLLRPSLALVLAATSAQLDAISATLDDDPEAALALLDAGLAADDKDPELLSLRAALRQRRGDLEGAAADLSALVLIDPFDDDARLRLARLAKRRGDSTATQRYAQAVLARHPENAEATALAKAAAEGSIAPSGDGGPAEEGFAFVARLGLGARYDSNVALDSSAAPEPGGGRGSGIFEADLVGGPRWIKNDDWLSLVGRAVLALPGSGNERIGAATPSTLGLGLSGELGLDALGVGGDLRYQELFADFFGSHVQRSLTPTLWGRYRLADNHTLRVLAGMDWRDPSLMPASVTGRLSLRDELRFSPVALVIDLSGRRNGATGEVDPLFFAPVDYSELAASLWVHVDVWEDPDVGAFAADAMGEMQHRAFDRDELRESTYRALAGVSYRRSVLEVRLDYAYTANASDATRSFDRHQLGAAVRAWIN